MNLQRCFEILDLPPDASLEEAKQAYKDIVNVWHPDRFPHNPRLRHKAEQKVKEINIAFAEVKAFLSTAEGKKAPADRAASHNHHAGEGGIHKSSPYTAEVIAEAGTRLILNLWSYLSRTVVHAVLGENRQTRGKKPPAGSKEK